MPIKGSLKKITEDGQEKDCFSLDFTNGAKAQLEELQLFFKTPDLTEVVKLGISFLQNFKEFKETKEKEKGNGKK